MARLKSGDEVFTNKQDAERFANHWGMIHHITGPTKKTVYIVNIGRKKKR